MTDIHVLFVDDETDYLETLIKRMLKRRVKAVGANSGEKAIEIIGNQPIDIVVLDVKMPGMNGIETLKAIKARHPMIEVIMLTGHANMEVAIEGMDCGAFDYIMKPVDIDDLLYKLEDAHQRLTINKRRKEKGGELRR